MEEPLFICCLLSRIFTVLGNSSAFSKKIENKYPNLKNDYEKQYTVVAQALTDQGILVHPSLVYSQFGLHTKTVMSMSFINAEQPFPIPEDIYQEFRKINRNAPLKSAPHIFWGYTGRYYDCDMGKGYIIDGMQSEEFNHIYFDFANHKMRGEEYLQGRLVHELLHDIGFEEHAMDGFATNIYHRTYPLFHAFIETLYQSITAAYEDFIGRVKRASVNHNDHLTALIAIAALLEKEGLSFSPTSPKSNDLLYGQGLYPDNILLF